jgi:hypothetical protein
MSTPSNKKKHELKTVVVVSFFQQQKESRILVLSPPWMTLIKDGQGLSWGLCLGQRIA